MAQTIFENMMQMLQNLSDSHAEATNAACNIHSAWLGAVVAETWAVLGGPGQDEPTACANIVCASPLKAVEEACAAQFAEAVAESVEDTKENAVPTTSVLVKPPAPVKQVNSTATTSKLGIAAAGRPPVFKKRAGRLAIAVISCQN